MTFAAVASLLVLALFSKQGFGGLKQGQKPSQPAGASSPTEVPLQPPDVSSIPSGPLGQSIRLGMKIIMNTPKYAASYVGNDMKCNDCHLKGGTVAYASPLAGVTTLFPAYTGRSGRVISMQERIRECFVRSENGKPIPDDSPEMVAMIAYMSWLSKGVPTGSTVEGQGLLPLQAPKRVDGAAGAMVYAKTCAPCHSPEGTGVPGMFPPLWGPRSFNDGAGMSQVRKMASFVKANMPPNNPGSLTVQQAFDVAAYVSAKPRLHLNPQYAKY